LKEEYRAAGRWLLNRSASFDLLYFPDFFIFDKRKVLEPKKIHTLPSHHDKRTGLRNNLTPAEATLWLAIKNGQLQNRKFRRQHSIEHYIVDFYCPSEKLIIELDGQGHFDPIATEYDRVRTARLNELGYTVIRFENKLVFKHMDMVLADIASHFKKEE